MPRIFPKRNPAIEHMLQSRHVILAGEHPFDWTGEGAQQFMSFASAEDFEAYVDKNKQNAWINEMILPDHVRSMFSAFEIPIPSPRLAIDVDFKSADGPAQDHFEEILVRIKKGISACVRRMLGDDSFEPRFIDMHNSRRTKKYYKHSAHIVVENVSLEDWHDVGGVFCGLMTKYWAESHPDQEDVVDKVVYSDFRAMRVLHSRKKKREPALSGDVEFTDSLITNYTAETKTITRRMVDSFMTHEFRKDVGSRKRPRGASVGRDISEGDEILAALEKWLSGSKTALDWGWGEARVMEGYRGTIYACFKVGFDALGHPRICAAGCAHNGGANKCWRIRVELTTGIMESMCYQNNRPGDKCQAMTRKKPWFIIRDGRGDTVRLMY